MHTLTPVPVTMKENTLLPKPRRGRLNKVATPQAQLKDPAGADVPTSPPDVLAMLPHARKIANWFVRKWGIPAGWDEDDVFHEGVIGLLKALPRYDPTRGANAQTYSGYAIRGALFRKLTGQWDHLNHMAPPAGDELEGPWPPPERAVLCREIMDLIDGHLGLAERTLVYGRADDETLSTLARQLGMPISTANRWHERSLNKVRRAAGVAHRPVLADAA